MSGKYEWATASAPKGVQLTGVESFEGAAFATGRRGILVERTEPGRWDGVFTSGATGDGRGVLDLSLTDDGERVWFSGASGVFGYYDRRRGSVEAHPAPYDLTSDFRSVSANGEAGDESTRSTAAGACSARPSTATSRGSRASRSPATARGSPRSATTRACSTPPTRQGSSTGPRTAERG